MANVILFVDVQNDFMNPDGKLYIKGAESIVPNLFLLKNAVKNGTYVIYTADWHTKNSKELSEQPDFKTTFPIHCLNNDIGSSIINTIRPPIAITIDHDRDYTTEYGFQKIPPKKFPAEYVIRKDAFDMFEGNPNTEAFLKSLDNPEFIVCGVATNVCVDFAIMGLLERKYKTSVVVNAIKELPGCDVGSLYVKWLDAGAELISTNHAVERISNG